jgi:iron complex transport system ATP-binding protein
MTLEARNVCVQIGNRRILHGISLEAGAGEVTAVVGPNGSGKTTLLRALSGDQPYSGFIRLNGAPVDRLKPWQAALMRAVLPQFTTIAFPFTVREVVSLGLTAGAGTLPLSSSLPERALERVELAGFAGRFYQELSGGEQQRVQLARVLCQVWEPVVEGVPRWLFLDEPVASLDIRHQLLVMHIAREFAEAGGGVLAIMHDLNLTAMFADRVAVMHEGRLDALGEPKRVINDERLERVFACRLRVGQAPPPGVPFVLPQSVQA